MRGWLNRMLLLGVLAGIARCGSTSPPPPPPLAPNPPAPTVTVPTADIGGLWIGTTRVTPCQLSGERCNAVNNVTFALTQYGSQVTGNYSCSPGSAACRVGGAGNSGKIVAGSVSGNQINLEVELPADKSECYYNGGTTPPAQANGVYVCYRGGRMIEEGVWALARQAPEE